MKRAGIALLVLYGLALAQLGWYIPRMPEVLATHYGAQGAPNGTMTRSAALIFHLAMLGVTALAFGVLPLVISRLSPKLYNIPHRQYWLAPERCAGTVAAIRERMFVMGCGTLLLLLAVSELNFRVNLNPPPRLPAGPFVAIVGGFLVFVAAWIVSLYRRFPKPTSP